MEPLALLFISLPYLFAFGFAIALAAFAGLALGRPVLLLGLYLAIFFIFPQSAYGSSEVFVSTPIYFRGSGQLFFPAVLWALLIATVWAAVARAFSGRPTQPLPDVLKWLIAWLFLFAGHVAVGLGLGHDAKDVMGTNGFVNIVWIAPLILLMVWSVAGTKPLQLLAFARVLVLVGLVKASYGLARWAVFGGDPTNIYMSALDAVGVKITFFDIVDALVCTIALVISASLLFVRRPERTSPVWDGVYVVTMLATLLCVVLSYRRTAWGGTVIVFAMLLLTIAPRWRVPVFALGAPALAALLAIVVGQRLGDMDLTGPARLIFDLTPSSEVGSEGARRLELRLGWEAFATSPIFGIGSWGRFASADLIPWQVTAAAGGYLHSGLLHILMKTGLVGLCLLAGLLWAFVVSVRRAWRVEDAAARSLVLAGLGGILFMVPDFLFGTPIPQVRTTQVLGFCLGLPAMVLAWEAVRSRARVRGTAPLRARSAQYEPSPLTT
jgi:O-antigen ligase